MLIKKKSRRLVEKAVSLCALSLSISNPMPISLYPPPSLSLITRFSFSDPTKISLPQDPYDHPLHLLSPNPYKKCLCCPKLSTLLPVLLPLSTLFSLSLP
ncbi:hypothetical protein CFOL_v3_10987 [Cephalotus follicularis]|uniref:Uncharacterized protein n=1 Tax=Cephalotus follicularis TaxID=3775 RepID=A0A1Q3BI06_CEPFO|nr:hypothetical protein CFOL_v3_10987 [Cephalotus follicularis]